MNSMSLKSVFTKAADLIRDRGHARYLLEDDRGRLCLRGAITIAINGDALDWSKETDVAIEALMPLVGGESPVAWNNAQGRTKTQVVRLLRKAAKLSD